MLGDFFLIRAGSLDQGALGHDQLAGFILLVQLALEPSALSLINGGPAKTEQGMQSSIAADNVTMPKIRFDMFVTCDEF